MSKRSRLSEMLRLLSYVTQFGMSVVSPIVLAVLFGVWLNLYRGVGVWVVVLLLGVGVISGGCGFYRFVRAFIEMQNKIPPHGGEGEGTNED